MSDRPRFTRKARARLDADERAQLIAEIAANEVAETFDLPHVEEQPAPSQEQIDAEFEDLWEPDLEPADTPRLAAEDMFAIEAEVEEIVHEAVDFDETYLTPGEAPSGEPQPEPVASETGADRPEGFSVADALASLARNLGQSGATPSQAETHTSPNETAAQADERAPAPWPEGDSPTPTPTARLAAADYEPWPEDDFAAPRAGDSGTAGGFAAEASDQPEDESEAAETVEPAYEAWPDEDFDAPPPQVQPEAASHATWPEDAGSQMPPADRPDPQHWPEDASEASTPEGSTAAPDAAAVPIADNEPDADSPSAAADAAEPAFAPNTGPEPEPEPQPTPISPSPDAVWAGLRALPVDPGHLERNLIITAGRHDPAHGAFDVLRTRLVQTLHDHDWKRVAVTSPTRDCGKTFTAVNLAISLSRYEAVRTVLMDMDMRNPSVANVLGLPAPGAMGEFLRGERGVSDQFIRLGRNTLNIGANLAVGLNDRVESYASELLQDPRSETSFAAMMQALDPDIVLYDMPPALAYDDVIAFRKHFDGILMVIGGGSTKADEVHEAMRRLGDDVPLLGVVLNQAESEPGSGYSYGY